MTQEQINYTTGRLRQVANGGLNGLNELCHSSATAIAAKQVKDGEPVSLRETADIKAAIPST